MLCIYKMVIFPYGHKYFELIVLPDQSPRGV